MTSRSDDSRAGPGADLPYRPCVGIALFEAGGRVFLGRRRDGGGPLAHAWQMPQGGIDPGEAPREAALRELFEETNVAACSVTPLAEIEEWLPYDLPADLTKRSWRGRYRGQTQRWFAFGFLGEDREIDIDRPGDGAHRPEFAEWRWAPLAEAPALIVPFKRPVYARVAEAFSGLTGWRAARAGS